MKKFKKIYLEITNQCNLSCSFCHKTNRPGSFITPDRFEATLRQIQGFSDHLCLHVLGEPLLHPQLPVLLEHCGRYGFQVNLTTNGFLLQRQQTMLLNSPALRQINISLHSCESIENRTQLVRHLTGIIDFCKTAAASTSLYLNLRIWNLNLDTPLEFNPSAESIMEHLRFSFSLSDNFPGIFPRNRFTLAPRIFLSLAEQFSWPHDLSVDQGENGFCRALRDHVAILVDGTVVPCCLDAEGDMALGNIHNQSFDTILASPRAFLIRQYFSRRKALESLCRRCTYRRIFDRAA